ncbi:MAG TPA: redoxin domain-containing protein [Tepidisphaeraceae bacterium]|jgi:peroxiredoxin|nr:redoxin domain-containing protein [Tepidisphaeraceae bacterium]
MSQRLIAHTGLCAVFAAVTLSISILGRHAVAAAFDPPVEVGKTAPGFVLPDTAGHKVSLADFRGHAVVLFFGSDACAVSDHYAKELSDLAHMYANDPRAKFIAINSNTRAHATCTSDLRLISDKQIPTLLDPMADVARSFGATVTPTFCVIDSVGTLRYAGAFDDGQADPTPENEYVARAISRTIDGIPCEITSTQAFGRSIAWIR